MTMTNVHSIRETEAALRGGGLSRSDAKRLAAEAAALKGTSKMSQTLARALEKFSPRNRSLPALLADPHARVPVYKLLEAREDLRTGLDIADTQNIDADLKMVKVAIAEIDDAIKKTRAAQADAAATARPVEGQENRSMIHASNVGAPLLRDVASGRMIRTYTAKEPVASDGGQPDFGVGDMVRAAVTGDWSRLPSHIRAGSAGIGSAGGFLVPSELAGFVVDLARAKARVLQAGALTVPMPAGNLTVATVTADPQPAWKAENAPFAVSQGSYGAINLVTRTLGVIVPLSLELVMSATNINELVTSQLVQRLGLTLDTAAIAGDGTVSQPVGIINNIPAGNVVNVGAALTSATAYGYWNTAIGTVLGANAELNDLSILHNSDVETSLDGLLDTLYQPLRPTPNYQSIKNAGRVYIANGIPTAGSPAESYSVVGDFKQVLFGMQQNLVLEISREGSYVNADGTTGNAFANGQILIRGMIMADVAVLRPTFFAQVNNIQV
jgi:HK97 family phage major capsid protein